MIVAAASACFAIAVCNAQVINPEFSACYNIRSLGSPAAVPSNLGGINFMPGNPNILLVGGAANSASGALYAVPINRDSNNAITGIAGPGTLYSSAPNIDGGVAIAPNNTIFVTTYSNNLLHQIPFGSAAPASTVSLGDFGVAGSTGTCQFVPAGFPGASRLKIASYGSGRWYDFTISDPVLGVYTMTRNNDVDIFIGGGPEGIVFVGAGNPGFLVPSCLVCEYGSGSVAAYELDANGDPIPATRRVMISGLGGAEGGVRDPITGSFIFSTFGGGNQIVIVEGFNRDCAANFNGDCAIDFFDYLDFVSAFADNDPIADFNNDEVIDFFDYLDFVDAYSNC